MKKISAVLTFISFISFGLFSQEALKSIQEEYYDYLSLTGIVERPSLSYRTLSDSQWIINDIDEVEVLHPWINNNLGTKYTLWQAKKQNQNWFLKGINQDIKLKIYGPQWFNSYNTAAPYGQNDGALWQGRGYNTSFSAGARIEAFGFEITIKPMIAFSQNLEFEYMKGVSGSEYNYFVKGIDLVQRYGDKAFWTFDWGDSEIRYTFYNFTVGFGTQNPWIGPAWLNPMLGSNNAGTYPKLDVGIRKTKVYLPFCNYYLGDIEGRTWIGYLTESDYFDSNTDNNNTMLNAFSFSFSPAFLSGLTFTANRIILCNWKKENLKYFFNLFKISTDNTITKASGDGEDQKISLSVDYMSTAAGLDIYGEIGIDDFSSDYKSNPFHTGIYTIGAKKNIPLISYLENKNFRSELIFEISNFEMSQDFQLQWQYGGYYVHSTVNHGYTNRGQILGAGSGYFGNSQYIGYTLYYPKGKTTVSFHRSCPNNNYIYNMAVKSDASKPSDTWYNYYATYVTCLDTSVSTGYYITPWIYIYGTYTYDFTHNYNYVKSHYLNNHSVNLGFNLVF